MRKEQLIIIAILAVVFFPITIWLIRYVIALFLGLGILGVKIMSIGKIGLVVFGLLACFVAYVIYKFKYE